MGNGVSGFDRAKYAADSRKTTQASAQSSSAVFFSAPTIKSDPSYPGDMDPILGYTIRESIETREPGADENTPIDNTTILVVIDNTGSMGDIRKKLVDGSNEGGLQTLFQTLEDNKIPRPQVSIGAVGDSKADDPHPYHQSQFEVGNKVGQTMLRIWAGNGGGGNGGESYHLAWYAALNKCALSCWERRKKGIIITVGDEKCHSELTAKEIRSYLDRNYTGGDLTNEQLLEQIKDKWVVAHVVITSETAIRQDATQAWKGLLGENHVRVLAASEYNKISQSIGELVHELYPELVANVRAHCDAGPAVTDTIREETLIELSNELKGEIDDALNIFTKRLASGRMREEDRHKLELLNALHNNRFTILSFRALIKEMDTNYKAWRSSVTQPSPLVTLVNKIDTYIQEETHNKSADKMVDDEDTHILANSVYK